MRKFVKESVRRLESYSMNEEKIEVKLNANESPYDMPINIKNVLTDVLFTEKLNRYPNSKCYELRKRISKYTGLNSENIIVGNGSDEIIKMIIDAFIDKNEVVVSYSPTFSIYKIITSIAGGKFIELENQIGKVYIDELINLANKNNAKVIFLCNPNNPTGILIPREDIMKTLEKTNSLVVVDEAYYEFCGETVIDSVRKYENLIVLRTLSKAFGLAGIRLGYGVSNKRVIEILNKVKPPYNINRLSQKIGIIALENKDIFLKHVKEIIKERNRLVKEIENIKHIEVFPNNSNFILIRSEKYEEILKRFKCKGVGVREYGVNGDLRNCIRISIGTKEENDIVLRALKEV
ncbi:histidinol-phosphate transaminase [Caminicella sporogenes]|uniref:histidinol-phosphate transaminase n=1 Tax=Caminicella sporogenes TaxID=166485 RepID=UPI002541A6D5|nr:histidinol-phosphate transaminase [Caminicella sporogenes]WIF95506.1 histidinol-phosphate transaminase [Caminicella sporogenes]